MKNLYCVVAFSILLTACASSGQVSDSSKLSPGSYTLKGYSADGRQLGGTLTISIPFNDPGFAVGILCSNKGTVIVKAENDSGSETTFKCIVSGRPAS